MQRLVTEFGRPGGQGERLHAKLRAYATECERERWNSSKPVHWLVRVMVIACSDFDQPRFLMEYYLHCADTCTVPSRHTGVHVGIGGVLDWA